MNFHRTCPGRRTRRAVVSALLAGLVVAPPAAVGQVAPAPATRPAAATQATTRPSADDVALARAVRLLRDDRATADAKAAACDVLRALGPQAEPAVSDLIGALWNPGPTRDAAAAALRAVGKPAINPLILEASTADARAEIARDIVRGMPGVEELVPFWVGEFYSQVPWGRTPAVRALGIIGPAGGEAATTALTTALRERNYVFVRQAALTALREVRPDADRRILVHVVNIQSADDVISVEAAQRLAAGWKTTDKRWLPVAAAALADALSDPNPRVRAIARQAFADAPGSAALVVPALEEAIVSLAAPADKPSAVNVRALAATIRLLNRYGPDAVLAAPVLAGLIGAEWPPVSDAAAGALIAIGPDAAPLVINKLKDKDVATRRAAVNLLPDLYPTGEPTVAALAAALRDADPTVAAAAAEALGRCAPRPASARPALTAALNDRDPDVRRAAKDALRLIGTGGD